MKERSDGVRLETDTFVYQIGPDGSNISFYLTTEGREALTRWSPSFIALAEDQGKIYRPTACRSTDKGFSLSFDPLPAAFSFSVAAHRHFIVVKIEASSGAPIERLRIFNLPLALDGAVGHIACTVLGQRTCMALVPLNLQTDVQVGRDQNDSTVVHFSSSAFRFLGIVGARMALVVGPAEIFRQTVKALLREESMVWSPVGGPFALDVADNRLSYLFAEVTEANVEEWIELAKLAGLGELLFYGFATYGSYQPYPDRFPDGLKGVRRAVQKVHSAGLKAGYHMHSFSIQKTDPLVTPKPHPSLAKGQRLTLAKDISPDETFIPTVESPRDLPERGGYWFRGGTDIQIGEEIIIYQGRSLDMPFGLTDCIRGAHGTAAHSHRKGEGLFNLKEVFGMYVPDPASNLFEEMTERIAEIINICEFDLIYFDGLDGADIFEGPDWAWHFGPRFAHTVFKKVKRPLRVEASAWYRHLWPIHSRLGAWDHPVRDPKRFIDIHCRSNREHAPNLLPAQLGWWAFLQDAGFWGPSTTPDVIEYLCAKGLGHDWALSFQNINPDSVRKNRRWWQMAERIGRFERHRVKGAVKEPLKEVLRQEDREFSLQTDPLGRDFLIPVRHEERKIVDIDGVGNCWEFVNPFSSQPLKVRIRALHSVAPFDDPKGFPLAEPDALLSSDLRHANRGVTFTLSVGDRHAPVGEQTLRVTATNAGADPRSAWLMVGLTFDPPITIADRPAVGLWIWGDGKGEIVNVQVLDIRGPGPAALDRYVVVDFEGWRYWELVEPEAKRWADYDWPYGHPYALFREPVDLTRVRQVSLYLNNIPIKETVTLLIGTIRALPLRDATLVSPKVTVGSDSIVFPVRLSSRWYLEMMDADHFQVFDPDGQLVTTQRINGPVPKIAEGVNRVIFDCVRPEGLRPRASVTLMTSGNPLALG